MLGSRIPNRTLTPSPLHCSPCNNEKIAHSAEMKQLLVVQELGYN